MKTVYRKEGGKLASRRVSDHEADKLVARGWLSEKPDEKPKRRGRPPKVAVAQGDSE